jgi:hypothetical protein
MNKPRVMIGLFLGGLLLFAAVGIVANMAPRPDATVTTALQSNVGAAVARPVQPTAIPTEWLKTQVVAESRWVFADYWFDCRYVAADGSEYDVGAGYAVGGWPGNEQFRALPLSTQLEIVRICHE